MTATISDHPSSHTSRSTADRADGASERGVTVISERVFAKIAGQAAVDVPVVSGRSGGLLGLGSSHRPTARPRVDVDLSAEFVDLELEVGIAYPGSIRLAASQVREAVTRRVLELTGVVVHRVDIDVTFLDPDLRSSEIGDRKEPLR